jgi:hypothetical protein
MTIATLDKPQLVQKNFLKRWFSFMFFVEPENVTKDMSDIQKLVILSSDTEYQAFLTYLDDRVVAIMHSELFSFDNLVILKNAELRKHMQASIHLLRSFDRFPKDTDLLIKNHIKIIDSLEKLTDILDVLATFDTFKPKEYDSYGLRNRIVNLYKTIYSQMQEPGTVKKISVENWTQVASKVNEPHSTKNQVYDFSILDSLGDISLRFHKALQGIEKAESGFLNVEDAYAIKEIKETYLPNLYRAVVSLKDLDASALSELEEDFAVQMDFVEVEINRIKNMLRDRAVDSVKSQTAFAKTKLESKSIDNGLLENK